LYLFNHHILLSCIYSLKGANFSRNARRLVFTMEHSYAFFLVSLSTQVLYKALSNYPERAFVLQGTATQSLTYSYLLLLTYSLLLTCSYLLTHSLNHSLPRTHSLLLPLTNPLPLSFSIRERVLYPSVNKFFWFNITFYVELRRAEGHVNPELTGSTTHSLT
jgi:hypothetical protein